MSFRCSDRSSLSIKYSSMLFRAALLFLALISSSTSQSSPLHDPVGPGAEARCGNATNGSNTSLASDLDKKTASCSAKNGTLKAAANLPNAELKAFATSPINQGLLENTAGFVDQITVRSGWDPNGQATGTFELAIDGMYDVSNINFQSEAAFSIVIWNTSDQTPPCTDDVDDCGFFNGPYDYAQVWFDLFNGTISTKKNLAGTGKASVLSKVGSDLRAKLSVTWTVDEANPSFYIAAVVLADVAAAGTTDFYNTAVASITGPAGFQFTSRNGLGGSPTAPEGVIMGTNPAIGTGTQIKLGVVIGDDALIGDYVKIGKNTKIGDNVVIGNRVAIKDGVTIGNDTTIRNRVRVCSGATIGSGVTIGKNRLIDTGEDVPDGTTLTGTVALPAPCTQ